MIIIDYRKLQTDGINVNISLSFDEKEKCLSKPPIILILMIIIICIETYWVNAIHT